MDILAVRDQTLDSSDVLCNRKAALSSCYIKIHYWSAQSNYCPLRPANLSDVWQVAETINSFLLFLWCCWAWGMFVVVGAWVHGRENILLSLKKKVFRCLFFFFCLLKTKIIIQTQKCLFLSVMQIQSIRDESKLVVLCQSLWSTASNALCVECQTWPGRETLTGKCIHWAARWVVVD